MQKNIEKISLEKCKSILEKDGSKYTNEEVMEIREFLYMLAEINYQIFLKQRFREAEFKIDDKNSEELKQAA